MDKAKITKAVHECLLLRKYPAVNNVGLCPEVPLRVAGRGGLRTVRERGRGPVRTGLSQVCLPSCHHTPCIRP